MKRALDLVVLSDVHLGTYGCHAVELLNYLKSIRPKVLVINGDFIDMWQFRKSYFPIEHTRILQYVLRMASKGVIVYYITGNHDEALRKYADFSSGNLHLRDKLSLQIGGKSYLIFHGDIFDVAIQFSPWLAKLGGVSYDYLIVLNRWINNVRQRFGLERVSMAHQVKHQFKNAIKYIRDFEEIAIEYAHKQHYDGVICGHIHRPQLRGTVCDGEEVQYLNSGDWVENLTALEFQLGSWSLYTYNPADFAVNQPTLNSLDEDLSDPQPLREMLQL